MDRTYEGVQTLMLATYHVFCAFPGCGHTAVSKEAFNWPLAAPPEADMPAGWSVVLRAAGEKVVVIAICGDHDFSFDGVKSSAIKSIGFNVDKEITE